jgi:hypothetical protein
MRRLPLLAPLLLAACAGGDPVDSAPAASRTANGPRVRWDLGARPLPEIPLPNDVATFADPSSPTGLRINASTLAPTTFESRLREGFDTMDGWGTFQPLTLSFDDDLDLAGLTRRMQSDDHRFDDDAVYLVNLRTGIPVPLDLGGGNFVYTARNRDGYYPNDPRGGQSNLLFETVDEDLNGNGTLDPGEDTNFDGRLNRAALFPRGGNPNDALTPFWEPDTRTLIVRPLLPLEERTRYAVVLTSRLTGLGGRVVRSPFPSIAHPTQAPFLEALDGQIRSRSNYYGTLAYRPAAGDRPTGDRVTFAWMFTTETGPSALLDLRRGLYGEGPFAQVARVTPDLAAARTNVTDAASGEQGARCTPEQRDRPYVIRGAALNYLVQQLALALGISGQQRDRLIEQYRYVSHVVIGTYRTPYPMGDPRSTDHHLRWDINPRTGEIQHLGEDRVQFVLAVPKQVNGHRAPFPVAFYGHGYTGAMLDALGFAPNLAALGIASAGINAAGHGLVIQGTQRNLINALLEGGCLAGMAEPLYQRTRARDLNGDGVEDSGGDFWTAYTFHLRDMVRQSALDHMQLIRAMRGFDGRARSAQDFNNDNTPDLAGDFDADGTPDVGGPDQRFFAWGGSLGGILSMILGSADPNVRAAAPVSGGGGLTDVGIRSTQGGVKEAVILRVMGPLVLSIPARDLPPDGARTRTACGPAQNSLRFVVPDVNDTGELEFACVDNVPAGTMTPRVPEGSDPPLQIAPGDDVVVTNLRNNESRCARVDANGRWRIGVPSNVDDPLAVAIFEGGAITDYGTCTARPDARVRRILDRWQVVEGDCAVGCGHIPRDPVGDAPQMRRWTNRDAPLTAPAEGMGLRRQSPELRRFLLLAQAAIDPADPVSFAPMYFLRPAAGHGAHALLTINTAGDQAVPVSTGNAFARAAGVIPFLGVDAATRTPELADYATPDALWRRYNRSPNAVLIDRYVLEGLSNTLRWPVSGRPGTLFDVDDLDEGTSGFNEQFLAPPLRLVRHAARANDAQGLAAAWTPTVSPWRGDTVPVAAVLNAFIRPEGTHSFSLPDPREAFEVTQYLTNLVARFYASDGRDLLYRSRPADHHCAARGDCDFLPPRPATQ